MGKLTFLASTNRDYLLPTGIGAGVRWAIAYFSIPDVITITPPTPPVAPPAPTPPSVTATNKIPRLSNAWEITLSESVDSLTTANITGTARTGLFSVTGSGTTWRLTYSGGHTTPATLDPADVTLTFPAPPAPPDPWPSDAPTTIPAGDVLIFLASYGSQLEGTQPIRPCLSLFGVPTPEGILADRTDDDSAPYIGTIPLTGGPDVSQFTGGGDLRRFVGGMCRDPENPNNILMVTQDVFPAVWTIEVATGAMTKLFDLPAIPLDVSARRAAFAYGSIAAARDEIYIGFGHEVTGDRTERRVYTRDGEFVKKWTYPTRDSEDNFGSDIMGPYLVAGVSQRLQGFYLSDASPVDDFSVNPRHVSNQRHLRGITTNGEDLIYVVSNSGHELGIYKWDRLDGVSKQFSGFQSDMKAFRFVWRDMSIIYDNIEGLLETNLSVREVDSTLRQLFSEITFTPEYPLYGLEPGDFFVPQDYFADGRTFDGPPDGSFVIQGINVEANGSQVIYASHAKFPTTLTKVFGDNQTTVVGTECESPFIARILDQNDGPLENVKVAWGIVQGTGTLSQQYTRTSNDGAVSSHLTLGRTSEDLVVRATALVPEGVNYGEPITVDFSVTATQRQLTSLVILTGNNQAGVVGRELQGSLQVLALDQNEEVLPNIPVTFNVTGGEGRVSSGVAVTQNNGVALTRWTLGPTDGENTLSASAGEESVTFTATANEVEYSLSAGDGNNQQGISGGILARPLEVIAENQLGERVANEFITWSVLTGGGRLLTSTVVRTNADGSATVEWQLGDETGAQTIEASIGDGDTEQTLVFTATASELDLQLIKVSGDTQTAGAGHELGVPIQVRVVNQFGDPVPYQQLTFTADNEGVVPQFVISNREGLASAIWRLGTSLGSQTCTVTLGTDRVSFSATAVAESYILQKISGEGVTIFHTDVRAVPLSVRVTDSEGQAAGYTKIDWTIVSGEGTLEYISTWTSAGGIASVSFTPEGVAGTQQVSASVGSDSVTFDIVISTGTYLLTWVTQPANQSFTSTAQSTDTDELSVRVVTQGGRKVAGLTVNFSVTNVSGTASHLTASVGASAQTDTNGVAKVTLTKRGQASTAAASRTFKVQASVGGLTADSSTFTISGARIAKYISWTRQPTSTTFTSSRQRTATNSIRVRVTDQAGNPVSGQTVTFGWERTSQRGYPNLSISIPNGTTDSSGYATVTLQKTGAYGTTSTSASYRLYADTSGASRVYSSTFTLSAAGAQYTLTWQSQPANVTLSGGAAAQESDQVRSVRVTDQNGSNVVGVTVSFAVTRSTASGTPNRAGARVVNATATTNASGVASVTLRSEASQVSSTTGASSAHYWVTATYGGVSRSSSSWVVSVTAVTVTLTGTGTLSIRRQPVDARFTNVRAATTSDQTVTFRLTNSSGRALPNVTVTFTLNAVALTGNNVYPGTRASASLVSTTATTNASGDASVTVRAARAQSSGYTAYSWRRYSVTASAVGDTETTQAFSVTVQEEPQPARAQWTTQPSGGSGTVRVTTTSGTALPNVRVSFSSNQDVSADNPTHELVISNNVYTTDSSGYVSVSYSWRRIPGDDRNTPTASMNVRPAIGFGVTFSATSSNYASAP